MTLVVRTSPDQETTRWPPGVPYIVGNEGCERFSYYGMKSILYAYMAQYLYRALPAYSARAEDLATAHYHLFSAGVYALALPSGRRVRTKWLTTLVASRPLSSR